MRKSKHIIFTSPLSYIVADTDSHWKVQLEIHKVRIFQLLLNLEYHYYWFLTFSRESCTLKCGIPCCCSFNSNFLNYLNPLRHEDLKMSIVLLLLVFNIAYWRKGKWKVLNSKLPCSLRVTMQFLMKGRHGFFFPIGSVEPFWKSF